MNSQANPATPGKTDIEIQKEEDNEREEKDDHASTSEICNQGLTS